MDAKENLELSDKTWRVAVLQRMAADFVEDIGPSYEATSKGTDAGEKS